LLFVFCELLALALKRIFALSDQRLLALTSEFKSLDFKVCLLVGLA
jgi:hypothetical protein